ncbi:hypothetical protein MG293_016573 [Ovis ammon polii]|uniref:SH2 domain-containing protein n=1 Tax=Ovis ammon polii TaxID=230172 RepID=A0AAD4TWK2_OVIAM|nr:hypothetical protein MG293_016573 [Ovis ammon polii]
MSSPLLAGSPTVGLAPCEEPRRALHPAPSPSLPPQCPYYTTEGWRAQALMAPMPCKGPPGRLQPAPQPGANASCLLQAPGEQVSGAREDLDSYIDFSLESLNQMILELDPTFQLLPPGPGGPEAQPTQSTTLRKKKEEPEALAPSSHPPTSPSISIPGMGSKASGPHGLGSPLVASPSLEKGLGGQGPQLSSRVSMLSGSPASDVSYVFGSSQSLLHSSISSHQSSSRSLESPTSSSSSLHSLGPVSLYTRTSDLQVPSNGTPSMGQPRATHSPPLAKEHASSCPPSITNSMVDIPIVLINGFPEPGSPPSQRIPGPQDFVHPGATSSSTPCPATRSHSQTLPEAPPTVSPEGPASDMQPTMKFVMDTSKYWFKPSISREQAIELLRKEEPGAFIVRDSSSYRGSFGLALKVQEAPTPAQSRPGEDSSGLIRHFLIESSAKGVHLKGADEEPYFGSLSAFVCQHSIMALALPCRLIIPQKGCHALYLSSVSVETLSGALAVEKAISATLERDVLPTPTVVHFKVTEQGITLTDVQRKVFFRRHYPLATLRFCGMDPEQRKIFGFVAKSQTESQENVCHLFAEYDTLQPASQVISLVGALLQGPERM